MLFCAWGWGVGVLNKVLYWEAPPQSLTPHPFIFPASRGSFPSVCLDLFLVSQELIQLAKKCDIIHAPESDHSAVSLVLQSNHLNQKRGPGFWKFNTALLKDEAYVTALKINIPSFKEKYNETHDLGLKWDLIKMEIRGFTIKYSKRKAKKYRDEEKLLHKKVNDLQKKKKKIQSGK